MKAGSKVYGFLPFCHGGNREPGDQTSWYDILTEIESVMLDEKSTDCGTNKKAYVGNTCRLDFYPVV